MFIEVPGRHLLNLARVNRIGAPEPSPRSEEAGAWLIALWFSGDDAIDIRFPNKAEAEAWFARARDLVLGGDRSSVKIQESVRPAAQAKTILAERELPLDEFLSGSCVRCGLGFDVCRCLIG